MTVTRVLEIAVITNENSTCFFLRYLIAAKSVKDIALALHPQFHLKYVKI
jgi:hypothetical protein